jgi:hypothetical protein
MPLSLSAADLRARAGLDSSHDAGLLELRDALLPVLERGLAASLLASADVGVQAAIKLGVCEVIAGEYLAQLERAPGARDSIRLFGLSIDPPRVDLADPSGLKAQGTARLAEFRGSGSSQGVLTGPYPEVVE